MLLIGTLSVLLGVAGARVRPLNKQGTGWAAAEAERRYGLQQPTPVNYDPEELDRFLLGLTEKLEDMPLPDDPNFVFVRDENKQVRACQVPEDDDDAMESSANPDDVMETVLRSFPDGKCAGRRFGDWYYQVCGNMAVQRAPYTVTVRSGKAKVTQFRAHESLGVLGRDRRVSSHHATVTDPRYVEQTYYDGAKCSLGGDTRRMQTTVTFECNRRFVSGYVHIAEVIEEHPCKYRLQLQSADFCDNEWLLGMVDENSVIRCRIYFHPHRIKPLMEFLDKYNVEQDGKKLRYDKYMAMPENKAFFNSQMRRPDAREKMHKWALESAAAFELWDAQWGAAAEQERNSKMVDYVMSELTWASMRPDEPYSPEEQRLRVEEEEMGRTEDRRRLAAIRNVLERIRLKLMDEAEDEDMRFEYENESYSELLDMSDPAVILRGIRSQAVPGVDDNHLRFYASWLDYIRDMEAEDGMVVRSLLIPPNRKFPMGSYLLLEGLIKSPYADSIRRIFNGLVEDEQKKPMTLYDGEVDQDDLEEIARKFMKIYKEAKKGGDTLLFELLDDEDFEY